MGDQLLPLPPDDGPLWQDHPNRLFLRWKNKMFVTKTLCHVASKQRFLEFGFLSSVFCFRHQIEHFPILASKQNVVSKEEKSRLVREEKEKNLLSNQLHIITTKCSDHFVIFLTQSCNKNRDVDTYHKCSSNSSSITD